MRLLKYISRKIATTDFGRQAFAEVPDLSVFGKRPSARVITGMGLMAFSYLIGWPMVTLLGILSIWFREPVMVVIGGPLTYGLSHLVFLAGFYLAGSEYANILMKWGTRKLLIRILGDEIPRGGNQSSPCS
jgi:hypothetical protein